MSPLEGLPAVQVVKAGSGVEHFFLGNSKEWLSLAWSTSESVTSSLGPSQMDGWSGAHLT